MIQFEKDKMTLRVPTSKLSSVGMRKLAEDGIVKKAMETLKGRARIKRTMWSRRAQEYEAKINSGDLIAIAEVVRDLYRSEAQPEQSYSERQLYEAALDRMAREIAAVDKLDERGAMQRITEVLEERQGPRRGGRSRRRRRGGGGGGGGGRQRPALRTGVVVQASTSLVCDDLAACLDDDLRQAATADFDPAPHQHRRSCGQRRLSENPAGAEGEKSGGERETRPRASTSVPLKRASSDGRLAGCT